MKPIDIDGKLIREVYAELKLTEIKHLIKELNNAIEDLEKILNYSVDYDAVIRAFRHLG